MCVPVEVNTVCDVLDFMIHDIKHSADLMILFEF